MNQQNREYPAKVVSFRAETQTVPNEQMIASLENTNSETTRSVGVDNDNENKTLVLLNDSFNSDLDKLGIALKKFFKENRKAPYLTTYRE